MADTGGVRKDTKDTLEAQSNALLKNCHELLLFLQSNINGDQPKEATQGRPTLPNPIDEAISKIEESRKVLEETRAFLNDFVINKLK